MKMELNLVLNQINSKFFVKMIRTKKKFKTMKKNQSKGQIKSSIKNQEKLKNWKLRPKRLFLKSRIKHQQLTTTLNPKTQLNPTHPDKGRAMRYV